MNTISQVAKKGTRRPRAWVGVVAGLVGFLVLTASPASAAMRYPDKYPGTVNAPQIVAWVDTWGIAGGLVSSSRIVTESPSYRNYDQWVCVTDRLWGLRTSSPYNWTYLKQARQCGWIYAAQSSIGAAGVNFSTGLRYWYGVDVVVTWQLANGATIGTLTVDYDATTDYGCGQNASCQVWNYGTGASIFYN